MPEGSEEMPVKIPAEGGPGGSTSSNASIASPSRVLPRVEAGDVLNSWEEFAEWKQRTSRMLWFYGGMTEDGVVTTENSVMSLMILSARLSRPIMKEGRVHGNSYPALWKWLVERYATRSATLISASYTNLMGMRMTASESVEDYVSRADACLEVLEGANKNVEMAFVIRTLIINLHPHWVAMSAPLLLTSIESINDLRDKFEALNITGHVPRRVEFGNAAQQVNTDSDYTNYNCHKCGLPGHIARYCPGPPTHPTLPTWRGHQPGRNNQRRGNQQNRATGGGNNQRAGGGTRGGSATVPADDRNWAAAAHETVRFTQAEIDAAREVMIREGFTVTEGAILKWLLDSGASKHMCRDRKLFVDLVPHCAEVEFGNGVRVRVYWKGTVILYTVGGPLTLSDVLFVPSLATNLFSVARASSQGARCTILENNAGAYVERSQRIICTAAFVNNLYWIEEIEGSGEFAASSMEVNINGRTAEAMQWHKRFAHLGFETLARMASLKLLSGSSLRPADFLQARGTTCETCVATKQMGKPHTSLSSNVSTVPLGRVFSDVTGNASDGFHVTFLDESTKWAASRALVHKSAAEVFAFVSETTAELERQTGHKLKRLRTDGGGEFDNALFREWFAKTGIVWEPTSRESPQQDGPGERLNRTVWDRVRPMMKASGLPVVPYLAHAVQYAIQIRNLTPSTGRDVTPHFSMFGKNIDSSRLQVFGCTAWVFVPPGMREKGKLADRSVRGVFIGLGLPIETNAYRIQLPTRIIQTSDVTFCDTLASIPTAAQTNVHEPCTNTPETVMQEEIVLPGLCTSAFTFPARAAVPGVSMQEPPLSYADDGVESTGSADTDCESPVDTSRSPHSAKTKPWMQHNGEHAQWQAFSEHVAANDSQDYGGSHSESSDSVRTDSMNMYESSLEQSDLRDDEVSLSDMLESPAMSHDPAVASPSIDSPDEVPLCQPLPGTPECSSEGGEVPLTVSPDEVPLRQPFRETFDVGVSPMTEVSVPSTIKRTVRDAVMNHRYFVNRNSHLDTAPESAVPVSAMFEPVSQEPLSQNAPIVAAPPRPDDWQESSTFPDIYWPPFSPPDTPSTSGASEQQYTADVLPVFDQPPEFQPDNIPVNNIPVNNVRIQPSRACKRAPDLPREPSSPAPKRRSAGDVVIAAMARTRGVGNIVTMAVKRVCRSTKITGSLATAASARYTPELPTVQALFIPRNLSEALAQPDADKWQAAVDVELAAMEKHQVWEIVDLPPGKRAIGSRMIFDRKRAEQVNGIQQPDSTRKYKARLVAQGFTQVPGVDFNLTYAPVCKYATLRAVLAAAAHDDLHMKQFDVKTAFLHATIKEEVYMKQPHGFNLCKPGQVLRLQKALYGTRQAGLEFFDLIKHIFLNNGWVQGESDPCMFCFLEPMTGKCLAVVYVDDGILAGPRDIVETAFKKLQEYLDVTDLGEPEDFLGMHIVRDRAAGTVAVHQIPYIQALVGKYKPDRPQVLPMDPRKQLVADGPGHDDKAGYSTVMGELQHLVNCTRPDIARAVSALSSYTKSPKQLHWEAAMQVIRYLHGTWNLAIFYGTSDVGLQGYTDSDFMGDSRDTRSTTGMVFTMFGGAVAWQSRLQPTIARSTCEAEYMAAAAGCHEALWLRKVLRDIGHAPTSPTVLYGDNKAALALLHNIDMMSSRVKHIDNRHHACKEQVQLGNVSYMYCASAGNISDCLTKAVPRAALEFQRASMGLRPLQLTLASQ